MEHDRVFATLFCCYWFHGKGYTQLSQQVVALLLNSMHCICELSLKHVHDVMVVFLAFIEAFVCSHGIALVWYFQQRRSSDKNNNSRSTATRKPDAQTFAIIVYCSQNGGDLSVNPKVFNVISEVRVPNTNRQYIAQSPSQGKGKMKQLYNSTVPRVLLPRPSRLPYTRASV